MIRCAAPMSLVAFAARPLPYLAECLGRSTGSPSSRAALHSAKYGKGRAANATNDIGAAKRIMLADLGRQLSADRVDDLAFSANFTHPYRHMSWGAQAVALHKFALADRERHLRPDHPPTLASRTNLAYAYRKAGLLAKAIPLYERSFADWTRLLGSDHPRALRSSNSLAAA